MLTIFIILITFSSLLSVALLAFLLLVWHRKTQRKSLDNEDKNYFNKFKYGTWNQNMKTNNNNNNNNNSNNPSFPLAITVTKPDNEVKLEYLENRNLFWTPDDRRSTMPCVLLTSDRTLSSDRLSHSSDKYVSSQEGSNDSINDGTSAASSSRNSPSHYLTGFISPARRFSDNVTNTLQTSPVAHYDDDDDDGNLRGNKDLTVYDKNRKHSVRPDRFSIISLNLDSLLLKESDMSSYDILNLYGQGKLCFSLSYNQSNSRLFVTINKAVYLNSIKKSSNNLVGFYVKIYLLNADDTILQMHKTEVVTATRNPMFEQTFSFSLSKSVLHMMKLRFLVKQTHHRLKRNTFLGGFVFGLGKEILDQSELFLEIWRDLQSDKRKTQNIGELSVLLMHNDEQGLLTVVIQRGRGILLRHHDNSIFSRCTLLNGDKPVKSWRSLTIKTDLNNPNFNFESIFTTVNKQHLGELGIVIHVCSRSKIGFSHLLGKITIGGLMYTDEPISIDHWSDVSKYPNRSVTKWHKLK